MSGVRAPYRATSFCFPIFFLIQAVFSINIVRLLSTLSLMPLATRGPITLLWYWNFMYSPSSCCEAVLLRLWTPFLHYSIILIFCADRSHDRFHLPIYLQNAVAISFIMRINDVFPYRFIYISLQLIDISRSTAALLLLGKSFSSY